MTSPNPRLSTIVSPTCSQMRVLSTNEPATWRPGYAIVNATRGELATTRNPVRPAMPGSGCDAIVGPVAGSRRRIYSRPQNAPPNRHRISLRVAPGDSPSDNLRESEFAQVRTVYSTPTPVTRLERQATAAVNRARDSREGAPRPHRHAGVVKGKNAHVQLREGIWIS